VKDINEIICPVCFSELFCDEKTYKCENNHSFDISKHSVVNLSLNNKSSKKRHGDDKLMVIARKNFLDKGFYEPILKAVTELAKKHCQNAAVFVDAGCGEGYYTNAVAKSINTKTTIGIDLSKEALRYFKKRNDTATAIVSSIFKMPVKTESVDLALNMFAPNANEEFLRILKKDGFLIRTFVLKNHLIELKQAIYDNAYYNSEEEIEIDGFEIVEKQETTTKIHIENEDIENLFLMTPYYYKTSKADQQKIKDTKQLDTTVSVMSVIYKKL